jgi:hypothetical protein
LKVRGVTDGGVVNAVDGSHKVEGWTGCWWGDDGDDDDDGNWRLLLRSRGVDEGGGGGAKSGKYVGAEDVGSELEDPSKGWEQVLGYEMEWESSLAWCKAVIQSICRRGDSGDNW